MGGGGVGFGVMLLLQKNEKNTKMLDGRGLRSPGGRAQGVLSIQKNESKTRTVPILKSNST